MNEDDQVMHEGEHSFVSEGRVDKTTEEDRRKEQRRKAVDRRDMIRFEIEKDDRRLGKDRRKDVTDWGDQPV